MNPSRTDKSSTEKREGVRRNERRRERVEDII